MGDSYKIDGNFDGLGNNVNMLAMVDLNKKPTANGKTYRRVLLRQQAWLLYGWLWNGAIEGPDNLYIEKVGMGGQSEANRLNERIIAEVKDEICSCDRTIEEVQAKKQLFVQRIEALETMALSAFANSEF